MRLARRNFLHRRREPLCMPSLGSAAGPKLIRRGRFGFWSVFRPAAKSTSSRALPHNGSVSASASRW